MEEGRPGRLHERAHDLPVEGGELLRPGLGLRGVEPDRAPGARAEEPSERSGRASRRVAIGGDGDEGSRMDPPGDDQSLDLAELPVGQRPAGHVHEGPGPTGTVEDARPRKDGVSFDDPAPLEPAAPVALRVASDPDLARVRAVRGERMPRHRGEDLDVPGVHERLFEEALLRIWVGRDYMSAASVDPLMNPRTETRSPRSPVPVGSSRTPILRVRPLPGRDHDRRSPGVRWVLDPSNGWGIGHAYLRR